MSIKTVQNIMHKQTITIQCQTPLIKVIEALVKTQQTQLPVVNSEKKLIGMVSLMDCQKALLQSAYHCDKPVTVNDIMAKNYTTLELEQPLSEVAIKTQLQTESLFPVQREGRFIGIIKRVDILIELNNSLLLCSKNQQNSADHF